MKDVIKWHKENKDWRVTRQKIHDKYYEYKKNGYEAPVSVVSSLQNGLCGVMAVLYGEGDFVKTTGIAVSAGYDCDNQAATCAGLIGVLNGAKAIPEKFTLELPSRGEWKKPFNDRYINYSRDELPNLVKISDIVKRIQVITEQAIWEGGGRKISENGKTTYIINCDF
jgi:ADP-ribosylglycohydrolase